MASIIQSRIRNLQSAGTQPRLAPPIRRLTALSPANISPTIKIVHAPKTVGGGTLKMPEKKKGFLANVGNLLSAPGAVIKGMPTFFGKTAQTAFGFGEGAFDFAADLASEIAGADKEFYTSRFETDLEKGRKLGLKGTDLIAYASQRQYPLGADIITSGTRTAGDIGELVTLGRKDFGEPGFNLYQAYKRGELPQRLLLEDIGNVMLAGRAAGLGSVAGRAGAVATRAGMPRLGTAIRRTGYLSEQPIAGTARGAARLAEKLIPETTGRGGRLVGMAADIAASERPFRTLGQTAVENRRNIYRGRLQEIDQQVYDVGQQISERRLAGLEIPEELAAKKQRLDAERKLIFQRTGEPKLLRQEERRLNRIVETTRNVFVQRQARFLTKGAVPESPTRLRRMAEAARRQAERTDNSARAAALNQVADTFETFATAKESDTTNRLSDRDFTNDSGAANILINTGLVDPIAREMDAGRITFDQAVELLLSDDNSALIAEQGYEARPSAVQRALDYVSGRSDLVDRVGIDSASSVTKAFSDFTEAKRQSGEGQVRGAASPFEPGNYPLPEYVINVLKDKTKVNTRTAIFMRGYIGNILEYVLSIYEQRTPDIRQQLNVENVSPDKLLQTMADASPDSPEYALAYQAIQQAFDDFAATPNPDFFPESVPMTPQLATAVRMFFREPLIYPAKARLMMDLERRILRASRGRDVETMVAGLRELLDEFPDLLVRKKKTKGVEETITTQRDRLVELLDEAMGATAKFDLKTWQALSEQLAKLEVLLTKSMEQLSGEMGVLDARRQNALIRINELNQTLRLAQDFVSDLVANPDNYFPVRTAEVTQLRRTAAEAQAQREAMGEISPLPTNNTYEARVKLDEENRGIRAEQTRIAQELKQNELEVRRLRARRERSTLTPDEQAAIEDELTRAYQVTDQYSTVTEVSIPEARIAKNAEIRDLQQLVQSLQDLLYSIGPFRRQDIIGRRPKYVGEFAWKNLSEDLNADINAGTGGRSEVSKEFIRRFTTLDEKEGATSPWDEWVSIYAIKRGIDDINESLTDAARQFTLLYDAERRLAQVRRTDIKKYRTQLSEQRQSERQDYLYQAYEEAGVRPPEDLIAILEDIDNPERVSGQIADLTAVADDLRKQAAELDRRWNRNDAEITRLYNMEQQSIPVRRIEEARRLEGVAAEAQAGAEALLTANATAQQRGIKSLLRGVGAYRDGRPVLQRQFERPIIEEQERLQTQQERDARIVEEKKAKFADEDARKAGVQAVAEGATAVAEQLAQPVGPTLLGEKELQYIPVGPSSLVTTQSKVSRRPGTEGALPEAVGSFEQMRTGAVVAMSPSQVVARMNELLNALGRNTVIQRIITNREFVSTVADRVPEEVRTRLLEEATNMNPPRGGIGTRELQRRIERDYKILLARELDRMGLEVITPVEMPDPNDPYATREALGALAERVDAQDITDTSLVMTKGLRETLGADFELANSRRIPEPVRQKMDTLQRLTGNWKAIILPFSIRWQIGDAVGNVINSWVRGDIPPSDLWKYMTDAYEMLRESETTPEGQPTKLRAILFGQDLANYTNDPLLQLLQSYGLQSSGANLADTMAMLVSTGSKMVDAIEGRQYRKTRVGQAFGRFQQGAFAFNEFQNRLVRQAVALRTLDQYLKSRDMTFDDVNYQTVKADPALEGAVVDAVAEANRVLGNFSDLSPYERQVLRTIFPFWSWIKFINKAAAQLAIDQPDRMIFMAHLAGMTMEPEADGMWEFLQGKTPFMGYLIDVGFLNPYSDALIFSGKNFYQLLSNAIQESESLSPAISLPLLGVGEVAYQVRGGQPFLIPTFSRPSYLEGRPGETTRTWGDTLGGLAYRTLRNFGGPIRNLPEMLPNRIPLIAPEGTIRGTDIAVGRGNVPRYPQGSLRTTGRYATPTLSSQAGVTSALLRTFGLPAPIAEIDKVNRVARENVRSGREAKLRRITERRQAERRLR